MTLFIFLACGFAIVTFIVLFAGVYASYRFPTDGSIRGRIVNTVRVLEILLFPSRTPESLLYDLWQGHNLNGRTKFINLGYWEEAENIDDACEDMAKFLADKAELNSSDEVLDVGFGFGDQDTFWYKNYKPKHITGINITQSQVDIAVKDVQKLGLEKNIDLLHGSATRMPFEAEFFDKVIALECAFHFRSRTDFFREAFRVLNHGGKLAIADIIPIKGERSSTESLWAMFLERIKLSFWQIPKQNQYSIDKYEEHLRSKGFDDVEVHLISDSVFEPLRKYSISEMSSPNGLKRLHPLHRSKFSIKLSAAFLTMTRPFTPMEYVIVTARKP